MISLSSVRLVRAGLALAVAFWMAGAGCMLGCENMVTAAASNGNATPANGLAAIVSGEACASAQSHGCCAKHKSTSRQTSAPKQVASSRTAPGAEVATAPPASMVDCPLALNATAALAKSGTEKTNSAVLAATVTNPVTTTLTYHSAFLHPLRLPNRGHTYLRCCVFLI